MPYRPLSIPERDFLFALYDKHGGNMLAMTRDSECLFKSHRQLSFYCNFYGFQSKLAEVRRRRAEAVVAELGDAKTLTIERAIQMMRPRQVVVRGRRGETIFDEDGQPIFETVSPSPQEIKTAWEIIKTEMGEPTTISKAEVSNPQAEEVSKALDVIERLAHGKPSIDTNALPGERGAAGDTAEVPTPVRDDLQEEPPAK